MGRKSLTAIITEFSAKVPDLNFFGDQLLVAPIRAMQLFQYWHLVARIMEVPMRQEAGVH